MLGWIAGFVGWIAGFVLCWFCRRWGLNRRRWLWLLLGWLFLCAGFILNRRRWWRFFAWFVVAGVDIQNKVLKKWAGFETQHPKYKGYRGCMAKTKVL